MTDLKDALATATSLTELLHLIADKVTEARPTPTNPDWNAIDDLVRDLHAAADSFDQTAPVEQTDENVAAASDAPPAGDPQPEPEPAPAPEPPPTTSEEVISAAEGETQEGALSDASTTEPPLSGEEAAIEPVAEEPDEPKDDPVTTGV